MFTLLAKYVFYVSKPSETSDNPVYCIFPALLAGCGDKQ